MRTPRNPPLRRRLADFCARRLPDHVPLRERQRIEAYLLKLVAAAERPPLKGKGLDWLAIGRACSLERDIDPELRETLRPALATIIRETPTPSATDAKAKSAPVRAGAGPT